MILSCGEVFFLPPGNMTKKKQTFPCTYIHTPWKEGLNIKRTFLSQYRFIFSPKIITFFASPKSPSFLKPCGGSFFLISKGFKGIQIKKFFPLSPRMRNFVHDFLHHQNFRIFITFYYASEKFNLHSPINFVIL